MQQTAELVQQTIELVQQTIEIVQQTTELVQQTSVYQDIQLQALAARVVSVGRSKSKSDFGFRLLTTSQLNERLQHLI
ncbi:hypothetical protein BK137_09825 [Viridibacillus arenosi]|uniref:Uncharacterized protein n=1 Tax=Viridibacillus arenosi FSL R5-213 TaxID=1227360 RepID=W4F3L9_9BACL|nr:hypothetical protein C176_04413 [Viridibacillus arenosi FSL R5-213]OMC91365.1 hypothetical protein BK137_09825 [Viridibacillus arenosi]